MDVEEAWIQKPLDVLRRIALLPSQNDNFARRFNTLTRLLIVICVILAVMKWKYWHLVLIGGLLILFQAYLSQSNDANMEVHSESKLKSGRIFNIPSKEMDSRPAASFYTKERILDTSVGVPLARIAAESRPLPAGEKITLIPKVVKTGHQSQRGMIAPKVVDTTLRLKSGKGRNRVGTTKSQVVVATQPQQDFMKIAFEELEEGEQANQDSKNMENFLL